jgi:hypothetical protein
MEQRIFIELIKESIILTSLLSTDMMVISGAYSIDLSVLVTYSS